MRSSLVVTFAAAIFQGLRFYMYLGQGRNLKANFGLSLDNISKFQSVLNGAVLLIGDDPSSGPTYNLPYKKYFALTP